MIVVKIENWPGGSPSRIREIARIFVRKEGASKYNAQLEEQSNDFLGIPAQSKTVIVEGHTPDTSVFDLLTEVLNAAKKSS